MTSCHVNMFTRDTFVSHDGHKNVMMILSFMILEFMVRSFISLKLIMNMSEKHGDSAINEDMRRNKAHPHHLKGEVVRLEMGRGFAHLSNFPIALARGIAVPHHVFSSIRWFYDLLLQ